MTTDTADGSTPMRSRIPFRPIGLLVVIGVVFSVGLAYRAQLQPALTWLEQHIETLGPWEPLASDSCTASQSIPNCQALPSILSRKSALAVTP